MATITNRSNFVVSVVQHPELTSSFPYNAQSAIAAHIKKLKEEGFKPAVKQLEDKLHVRLRRVG